MVCCYLLLLKNKFDLNAGKNSHFVRYWLLKTRRRNDRKILKNKTKMATFQSKRQTRAHHEMRYPNVT